MSEPTPIEVKNLDIYGDDPLEWGRVLSVLGTWRSLEHTWFLGTARPDGTPHSAGVGVQRDDGHIYFTSSPSARKARDLAANPRCTLSAKLPSIDVTLNGTASRVTD